MASETDIVNFAFSLMGDKRINDIDEEDEESALAKLFYKQARDELLAWPDIEWVFAKTRANLETTIDPDPIFNWDHAFQIPVDIVRVINQVDEWDQPILPWVRELDQILTNEDTCRILYITKITDTTKFPALFVKALYYLLGSVFADRISLDKQKADELLNKFLLVWLPKAKAANGREMYLAAEKGSPNPFGRRSTNGRSNFNYNRQRR